MHEHRGRLITDPDPLTREENQVTDSKDTGTRIENTSTRDPLLQFAGMLGGTERYIEEQEAAGQSQLVNSTMLPTKMNSGTEADLIALGFTLGDQDPADPMFRTVTLPKGWSKTGTDHSMWSKVVDEHGRPRLTVFYKAAFYDRDAFINVQTLSGYAFDVINGEPLVLDDEWAIAEAMRAAVQEYRDSAAEDLATYSSDYKLEQIAKADRLLASMPGGGN